MIVCNSLIIYYQLFTKSSMVEWRKKLARSNFRRLGCVVRFVVVMKLQGPRFDPGLANYVCLANNLGSSCEDKHNSTTFYFCNFRCWRLGLIL